MIFLSTTVYNIPTLNLIRLPGWPEQSGTQCRYHFGPGSMLGSSVGGPHGSTRNQRPSLSTIAAVRWFGWELQKE